jgi:hypothetical protein
MRQKSAFWLAALLERDMNVRNRPLVRWLLLTGYLVVVAVLLACAAVGSATESVSASPTPAVTETALLRLEDGAVQVKGENTDWVPVAGESTFELVGDVESIDPWMVTGNTFAVRDTTRIAEGLEVGDRVRVRGIILADNTWLANSIEPANDEEQPDPIIILIGKVNSIDPWVVHGITLNVTTDTVVSTGITPDMIVLVEILLLDDGTWEVLSITPLSHFIEIPDCATVTATVASVDGDAVQFAGWPVVTLSEEVTVENEAGELATLEANQRVLVVICTNEDTQFTITKIILLDATENEIGGEGGKVLVCHKPDKKGGHTLSIAEPAVTAHLAHGDKMGACP